ncbi:hypothetical protein Tco_1377604 [Tanacetum coccineum]
MRYRVSKKESWNGGKWLNASMSGPAVQQLWTLYPGKQTANLMTNTQTPPTVVNTTGAPVTNAVANHAEKPEKFNGQNFKRWQQKMFFYLTTLGLARFLKETAPQVEPPAEGQSSNAQAVQAVEAWKHSDFLCHNYVLNGLIDPLYNVYCKTTTAKELWESLERKYKTEDAGTKKFVVARFLDYKMVDSKSVVGAENLERRQVYINAFEEARGKWFDFLVLIFKMNSTINAFNLFLLADDPRSLKIIYSMSNNYGIGVNKDEVLKYGLAMLVVMAGVITFNYIGLHIGSFMKSIASWEDAC